MTNIVRTARGTNIDLDLLKIKKDMGKVDVVTISSAPRSTILNKQKEREDRMAEIFRQEQEILNAVNVIKSDNDIKKSVK